jgi:sarcosine oxidase
VSGETFDHLVIGGGPMGASAARYLAQSGARVMLLAPRDPATAEPGTGLPSSHADLSRITRQLDVNPVWARLAAESIARYRDLEHESGIDFFTESGCLAVVEGDDERAQSQLAAFTDVASGLDIHYERLTDPSLAQKFPSLRVAPGTTVLHEQTGAGWIDPRAFVRAQIAVGVKHGLEVAYEPMAATDVRQRSIEVTTQSGRQITGDHALFAMGPYSAFDLPVADSVELEVYARTVVHVRLSELQLWELGSLPSLIVRGTVDDANCYILPPARYPDGHWYIKIGGGRRAQSIGSRDDLAEWFAGPGDAELGAALLQRLHRLLPVTRGDAGVTQACAITVAPSGLPRVVRLSDRTVLATGGNGHAAKSGDEIGLLAAQLALGNEGWDADFPAGAFSA